MNVLVKSLLLSGVLVLMFSCKNCRIRTVESFTDPRDGKVYQCKKIGNRVWMVENLAYETQGGGSVFYASSREKYGKFGRLYSWESLGEACDIEGWHLPDSIEWMELLACYRMDELNLEAEGCFKDGARWEGISEKEVLEFCSAGKGGFNFQFGGMWHLKWLDPNSPLQRSFEYMGQNGHYWAGPLKSNDRYSHFGMGTSKYNWIELSSKKPGASYRGGEDYRFYVRLVKNR